MLGELLRNGTLRAPGISFKNGSNLMPDMLPLARLPGVQDFYEKHGSKTIILARFVPIVRTFAPFVAGVGSMQYTRYISYCIMGAILWVGSITLAGYFLGSNEWIQHNFEKVVLGIVAASLLPVVFQFIKHKLAK